MHAKKIKFFKNLKKINIGKSNKVRKIMQKFSLFLKTDYVPDTSEIQHQIYRHTFFFFFLVQVPL